MVNSLKNTYNQGLVYTSASGMLSNQKLSKVVIWVDASLLILSRSCVIAVHRNLLFMVNYRNRNATVPQEFL